MNREPEERDRTSTHQLASSVQHEVDDLLADGVVTAGVVIGRVFLPCDQLLRVEQLAVGSGTNLVWRMSHREGPLVSRLG